MARDLLGKTLSLRQADASLSLAITETEAYLAEGDEASHSWRGMTKRNAVMFGPPGHAYVYFIYGMHHCLNVVTEAEGTGAAVLVRGVEGVSGPGRVAKAYGITLAMNGWDLTASDLSIGSGPQVADDEVVAGPRVGITRSAQLPLRFRWRAHGRARATDREG